MSELLKGNFMVKNKVKINEENEDVDTMNEYRKKALESIGGSMVFVERDKLFWDDDSMDDK
jgi:hypothetical protein